MPAKISQDVRERQLRELAEADGYTFVGWVDKFINNQSKAIISCPAHGEWAVSVNQFVSARTRCKKCVRRPGYMTLSECEMLIKNEANIKDYDFGGWVGEYSTVASKIKVNCQKHGEWRPSVHNFLNGKGCYACGRERLSDKFTRSWDDTLSIILQRAAMNGVEYVKIDGDYDDQYSRVIMRCPYHGEYSQQIAGVTQGKQCRKCSLNQLTKLQQSNRLHHLAASDNIEFIGYHGDYVGVQSKAIFRCFDHGEWACSINSFVSAGSRCPDCAGGGYDARIPGTCYALLSDCRSMVKIGISNNAARRHTQLANSTPFNFIILRELHCEDGSAARMLERIFHDTFPSAGLSGFDGATEWRVWHDDVNTWFDILGG